MTDAPAETLTVRDNRTGQEYEIPITDGTIRAADLGQIKTDEEAPGLATYDPGFVNTASTRSAVTFIDGEKGILRYRGYPIEQLAEKSTFLEVAYLLIHGELPTKDQHDQWVHDITYHTYVHENVKSFMHGFRYDAHPMGMLMASVGALSTFYPESQATPGPRGPAPADHPDDRQDADPRRLGVPSRPGQAVRLPRQRLLLRRELPVDAVQDERAPATTPTRASSKALDLLFILHADHEQNCSTNAVRSVGSSGVDPYAAVAAGIGALYGPLHGGANEAVLRMLRRIGTKDNIPDFIRGVKDGNERLMGFGHRVYKNYDPRATIIKQTCDDVFEVTGVNPLLEIAQELEQIALEDDYFKERKLYPNVDFYTGVIYKAMGFPTRMFTVLFAIGRLPGWLAQWLELVQDKDQKIARPKQIYTGDRELTFTPAEALGLTSGSARLLADSQVRHTPSSGPRRTLGACPRAPRPFRPPPRPLRLPPYGAAAADGWPACSHCRSWPAAAREWEARRSGTPPTRSRPRPARRRRVTAGMRRRTSPPPPPRTWRTAPSSPWPPTCCRPSSSCR